MVSLDGTAQMRYEPFRTEIHVLVFFQMANGKAEGGLDRR